MTVSLKPTQNEILSPSQLRIKIDSLNEQAWKKESIDPVEGMRLSKEAYQLSINGIFQQTIYQKGVADSLFNQAHFNLNRGDYSLALSQSIEALAIYNETKDDTRQAQTLRNLGSIYLALNEYNKAMSTLLKSLEIARGLQEPAALGETLLSIGVAYLYAGDVEQSIIEFKKSLQIFQNSDNARMLAYAYCYLAAANLAQGEFDIFHQYLERSSRYSEQIGSDYIRMDLLRQKGQFEMSQGNLDFASRYFQESLELAQKHSYQADEVAANLWLSEVDHRQGNPEDAISRLLGALMRAQKNGFMEGRLRAHNKLSRLFEEQKDFENAYQHMKAFYDLEKHLDQEKNDLRFKTLETIYRTQAIQNEARIIQTKNDQLQKEITERKWVEEALRQSEEKYRRLANLDPLTSLNNRRYFYELAMNELRRVKRYKHPLSILMLDIDHFKDINDRLGHLAGDQVLQWIGRRLEEMLREVDVLGRFGGEEFIIMLPETDALNAKCVANRLCQQFAESRFEVRGESVSLTVSIGVASYEEDVCLDTLIDRADQTMYVAKEAGRNRCFVWGLI